MLLKDFYTIETETGSADSTLFCIRLNPGALVYEGHFPGSPITPGVCNIQLILECASRAIGFDAIIQSIKRCRFLKPVIPSGQDCYDVVIKLEKKETTFGLEASLTDSSYTYVDFKGEIIKRE